MAICNGFISKNPKKCLNITASVQNKDPSGGQQSTSARHRGPSDRSECRIPIAHNHLNRPIYDGRH